MKRRPAFGMRWTKEDVRNWIWLHYKNGEVLKKKRISEIDPHLVNASERYFDSWHEMLVDMGIPREDIPLKKWHKDDVVEEIRRLDAKKMDLSFTSMCKMKKRNLYQGGKRVFGSWENALNEAGVDASRHVWQRTWTKEIVREKVEERYRAGKMMNVDGCKNDDQNLYAATCKYFGSWKNAVEASGINYEEHRQQRKWNEERIVEEIRTRAKEAKPLYTISINKEDSGLKVAAMKYFGSWRKAVEAAGMDYNDVRMKPVWTKEMVINEIQLMKKRNENMKSSVVKVEKSVLYIMARKYFGGWMNAVRKAGIAYEKTFQDRKWNKENIVDEIIRRAQMEKSLSRNSAGNGLVRAAARHFGSWEEALQSVGLNYDECLKQQKWSEEKVINEIRKRERLGKSCKPTVVKKDNLKLYSASQRHFGTWSEALEAAGKAKNAQSNQPAGKKSSAVEPAKRKLEISSLQ